MKKFMLFSFACIVLTFAGCASVSSNSYVSNYPYSDACLDVLLTNEQNIIESEMENTFYDINTILSNLYDCCNVKKMLLGDCTASLDVHIEKESFDLSFQISK